MSEPKRPATGAPLPASSEPAERRVYMTPALVEYGSVAKLTHAGGMTSVDFLFFRGMGMTM
jgi:hypothetical protein